MKKRDESIDGLKGILILFVILGHTTLGLNGLYEPCQSINLITSIIYSFHMPCFIAISGYLFQGLNDHTIHNYLYQIKNKLLSILLPYFLISIIYWIIKYTLSQFVHDPISVLDLIQIPWKPIEFLWYLYALFLLYFVAYSIPYKCKELLFVIFFVIALFCYGKFSYEGFNYISGFMMYFYLGCLIQKYNHLFKKYPTLILLSVLSFGMEYVYFNNIINVSTLLISNVFSRLVACTMTIFLFSLCLLIGEKSCIPNGIKTIGRDSMPFYAMHVIFVGGTRIVLNRIGITNLAIHCIVGFFTSLIICWILYEQIFKKIKWIDFIFYPRKYI